MVFRGVPGISNVIIGAVPALCETAPTHDALGTIHRTRIIIANMSAMYWTQAKCIPVYTQHYLSGTVGILPTRSVFGGGSHCRLICAHRVSQRQGYVGYTRKALEKGFSEMYGLGGWGWGWEGGGRIVFFRKLAVTLDGLGFFLPVLVRF